MAPAKKKNRHNQETILFILMGLIIIGLIISGYMLFVGKILPELAEANKSQEPFTTTNNSKHQKAAAEKAAELLPPEQAQSIRVYFPLKGKDKLGSEIRKVRKSKMLLDQAREILEVVLSGPESDKMYTPIPSKATLRGIFFKNGQFIVDLSSEFKTQNTNGASDDILAIYLIVSSLAELDPKVKVQFLINGTEEKSLRNHVDLSQPIARKDDLI